MSLGNGESIVMSKEMCIILEADSLEHSTPATISRCGMIFIQEN